MKRNKSAISNPCSSTNLLSVNLVFLTTGNKAKAETVRRFMTLSLEFCCGEAQRKI